MKRKWGVALVVLALALVFCLPGMALANTYSNTDFNNPALVSSYNGTYVAGTPGYMYLTYTGDDDAVVGVRGPLGILSSLNMSFTFSNPSGTGDAPFAAFGISDNSTWGDNNHRLNVISMSGNQLIGTSLVHVWNWNLNGDVAGFGQTDGATLNSVLATYGTWEVMRAYAYIGDTGGASSGSVNINSITVSSVPLPPSVLLLGSGILGMVGLGWRRRGVKSASRLA